MNNNPGFASDYKLLFIYPIVYAVVILIVSLLGAFSPDLIDHISGFITYYKLDFFWFNLGKDLEYFVGVGRISSFAKYHVMIILLFYSSMMAVLYQILFVAWPGRPAPKFLDDPFYREPALMLLGAIVLLPLAFSLEFVFYSDLGSRARLGVAYRPLVAHNDFLIVLDAFFMFCISFFVLGLLTVLLAVLGFRLPIKPRSQNTFDE